MNLRRLNFNLAFFLLLFALLSGSGTVAMAQQSGKKTVTGKVVDELKIPLPGVTILVPETTNGVITDFDGNYTFVLPEGTTALQFSYIGFETKVLPIPAGTVLNVTLLSESQKLGDVVVIGYGVQRKSDLTGSITSVGSGDFNGGLISSPEQLIAGKVSGVQIMSNSGSPTAGSTIRIRGGASLNASNDPLIVLDGVPLESGGISGNTGNFMSLINPNDIENMTILKDAASTAIYGSRASNGVILITTKKGSAKKGMEVSLTSTQSLQTTTRLPDMLSRSQFEQIIRHTGSAKQIALLGDTQTDWNDQIYHNAFGTDNNLSISSRIWGATPLRFSVGYYNQDGILKTDNAERLTGSLSVSPSFFKDYLKLNLSARGTHNNNNFANGNAIWAASTFNPTLPVYAQYPGANQFGGYHEAIDANGQPVNAGVRNPLGLLKQYNSTSTVDRVVGNFDADYKFHFLPDLRFHTTLGYDFARGKGNVYVPAEAAEYFTTFGRDYGYGPQENVNKLLTTYFTYNKYIESLRSNVEATLGYDYQNWKSTSPIYSEFNTNGELQSTAAPQDQRHVLISYYARLNYNFAARYMLTASLRRDGTSRFNDDNRWGAFPSVALAWRVDEESFLKDNDLLSTLKMRVSYGITGQQDGIGNYNYLPVYTISQEGAQVQFGNQWYNSYRPEAYVSDLKWETTRSWNAGFDFGFLKDRITGSAEYYTRRTEDLLATVPVAAGTNFDKTILTNVGNVDSKGVEITLNATPVRTNDWNWDVSFNLTWQKMKVKNLSLIEGGSVTNTLVGPTIDSYQFQVLTEGYEPYMFYLHHQLYDQATGKPVEGAFADLNGDGIINSSDLYRYHSPAPDYILGLSTALNYRKWTLNMNFRANIGNYVYNGMAMNSGAWSTVSYNDFQLNNLSKSYLETGFHNRQYLSDYYVENASFLKLDNLVLNYNFGKLWNFASLNVNCMVQNVFTITKYSGVDPEVPGGMDLSFYPRPRTYSVGIGVNF